MFIGRKAELEKLNQMYHSDHFEFAVIYGRRRIGKTTLITEFCKDKKAIYYMSAESTAKENLENLSRAIFEVLVPNVEMPPFQSFDIVMKELFLQLMNIPISQKVISLFPPGCRPT